MAPLVDITHSLGSLLDVAKADKHKKLSQLISENSGWHGTDAVITRAVIMSESSGDPSIVNSLTCVGLMQICFGSWAGKFGAPKDKNEFIKYFQDPATNISYAYTNIWKGSWPKSAGQWEAYSTGRYRKWMPAPPDPDITIKKESAGISDIAGVPGQVLDKALGPIDEIASALLSADTWARFGKGILGGVILILGTGAMVFVIANKAAKTPAGSAARRVAVKAATKGIDVKAAQKMAAIPK